MHEKMFKNISHKLSPPPLLYKFSKFSRNTYLPKFKSKNTENNKIILDFSKDKYEIP